MTTENTTYEYTDSEGAVRTAEVALPWLCHRCGWDNGQQVQACRNPACGAARVGDEDLEHPDARRTGGGYENAPATRMLATHCAVCRRPLVDAKSVELGIGPDCRRKYGYDLSVSETARHEANKIVHGIAMEGGGLKVAEGTVRLRELGFDKLAAIIMKRACPVRIEQLGQQLLVWAPFNDLATTLFRNIGGRRWHGKDCDGSRCGADCATREPKEKKFNSFPVTQKESLFKALVRAYNGLVAMGPKGAFKIGAVA